MMASRQEIHMLFHRFPQAARTCSKITSWTKVTCHPHFFKHHNMRERMLDANPYKCEDSHTPPKPSVPVKAVRTAQTLQSWEVKTSTSESAALSAFVSAVILGHPTVFTPTALDSNASFAIPRLWRQPGSWHCGGPSTWSPKINCSKTIWWTAHQPNSWDLISWNHHSFFVFCLVGFPTLGTDRVT